MSLPDPPRAHILIVEDDEAARLMARTVLERAGYAVDAAPSAEDARVLLKHSHPDLILMDLLLPGIDGLEFTRQLKADPDTAQIPVVALTGQAMPLYERAAYAAGCDGFMVKVGSSTVLGAQVSDFLETHPRAGVPGAQSADEPQP
jgi:CheY-like chemotaxis protein